MGMVTGRRLNSFYNKVKKSFIKTREELEANTEEGYIADALLVKEINSSLNVEDVSFAFTPGNDCSIISAHKIGKLLMVDAAISSGSSISHSAKTVASYDGSLGGVLSSMLIDIPNTYGDEILIARLLSNNNIIAFLNTSSSTAATLKATHIITALLVLN